MRLTNVLVVSVVLIMALFLASCSDNTSTNAPPPYSGGYDGLVAKMIILNSVTDTGAKNQVWENEAFPLTVELQNKGEYSIPAHEVVMDIKGISKSDFTGIDFQKDNADSIEKTSELMPEGGIEYVDFGQAMYNNLEGTYYDANVFLYYVYPYETRINIQNVCYKDNMKDTTVCTVDETKRAYASGGPIQVGTTKERYIGKGKILLEIPIKNVQDGYAKAYKTDEFRPEWDEIYFTASDSDWECKSRGNPNIARISHPNSIRGSEEVLITCINSRLELNANFLRPMTLTLTYYYQDWINQVVRIRENPE
jgi:hypothetical protein